MSSLRIGVVIPTYNIERYLQVTLDALLAQTYPQWQAVVVDDGSKDGTRNVIEAYAQKDPRIRFHFQANQGGAAARENGQAALPDVDAYFFFDHDDRLRPYALADLSACLTAHPAAPAVYGLAAFMNENGDLFRRGSFERHSRTRINPGPPPRRLSPEEPVDFATLLGRNVVPIGGILIRAEAKRQVGAFDPEFGYAHDWEMWLRLSLLGPLPVVNRVVYDYRVLPGNMSSQSERFALAEQKVLRKFVHDPLLPAEVRETARLAVAFSMDQMIRHKRWKALRRWLRGQPAKAREIMREAQAYADAVLNQ